jgi:dethiobiotin synthetase
MTAFFVTGTDTDVGKTVAASWLMLQLDGNYWKPVQSGRSDDGHADIDDVRRVTEYGDDRFFASTYDLTQPLSPHEAAKRDGVEIDMARFSLPESDRPLVVEGAGGLMVPLNKNSYVIDLIKALDIPAVLVCRSGLGTINHTLLSLEALAAREIPVAGLIINGALTPHNREALEEYGQVPVLAEIDRLPALNKEALLSIKPEIDLLKERKAA